MHRAAAARLVAPLNFGHRTNPKSMAASKNGVSRARTVCPCEGLFLLDRTVHPQIPNRSVVGTREILGDLVCFRVTVIIPRRQFVVRKKSAPLPIDAKRNWRGTNSAVIPGVQRAKGRLRDFSMRRMVTGLRDHRTVANHHFWVLSRGSYVKTTNYVVLKIVFLAIRKSMFLNNALQGCKVPSTSKSTQILIISR